MTRKNESPQKVAMREMMKNYLKDTDLRIQDESDVKNIMRDMMSVLLEGALDVKLDDSLGYNKYDHNNKNGLFYRPISNIQYLYCNKTYLYDEYARRI